jgi:hypothetical protein
VTPTTLGGLHGTRTAWTTNFEVLVSPLCLGWLSELEVLVDRSFAIAFSVQGISYRSRTSKSFFSLRMWSR